MSTVDASMTREVYRDLAKRPIDVSGLDIHVQHGVVYLRGRVERVRGYWESVDLQEEINIILKMLHQKMGVRDVVCEIEVEGAALHNRVDQRRKRAD